ncbi:hypothetical protein INT44_004443 [Umbelopsis vinacea]|uniref:Glycosyltransferase 61 catalytic domain-containing protein n=1 Tax=Umbelopsis vinacea TaxID=44442 RepID=A0A8H7QD84_9FUNG|nr:hypothetical protein INT44_004443 [Umbelopsis vinacea]
MLTNHITGYREKVQALVAMDLNDDQGSENYQEVIGFSGQATTDNYGRPIDNGQESKWMEGYNNYSDMEAINEDSLSRPYSFLYKLQEDNAFSSISSFCDERYGFDVIRNWRRNVKSFCDDSCPSTSGNDQCDTLENSVSTEVGYIHSRNSPEISKFSMECSMIHMDIPENLCHTKNLVLNLDELPQEPKRGSIDMFLVPGSTEAKCKLKDSFYDHPSWGFGGSMWLYSGLESRLINEESLAQNVTCDAWIEEDLYLISRYDTGNVYHIHQDLIQAFIGLAASDMNIETTEIVFLDSNEGGISSLNSLWTSLFSSKQRSQNQIRTIRDIVQEAQEKSQVPLNNICFRSATFGFHAGVTLFSREKAQATSCGGSVVLKAYIDYVLSRLNLPLNFLPSTVSENFTVDTFKLITPPNTPEPTLFYTDQTDLSRKPLVVTFLSRNPTKNAWNVNTLRKIGNEHSVMLQLQARLESHFSQAYFGRALVFRRVNPADLPTMQEQIALARESDIIIGPHGASLIYTSFMPSYGGVIELQHPTRRFNYQFYNIAALSGPKLYRQIDIGDSIRNIRAVESVLLDTVEHVLRRMDNQ